MQDLTQTTFDRGGVMAEPGRAWMHVVNQMARDVVEESPAGLCSMTDQHGLLGRRMVIHASPTVANGPLLLDLRRHFNLNRFDALFRRQVGWSYCVYHGPYEVVLGLMDLGAPRALKRCVLVRVAGPANERAVLVFNATANTEQLASDLLALESVLLPTHAPAPPSQGGTTEISPRSQLVRDLESINIRRLLTCDLNRLARIVNGLDDTRDELPRDLKLKYRLISDYILKRHFSSRDGFVPY